MRCGPVLCVHDAQAAVLAGRRFTGDNLALAYWAGQSKESGCEQGCAIFQLFSG